MTPIPAFGWHDNDPSTPASAAKFEEFAQYLGAYTDSSIAAMAISVKWYGAVGNGTTDDTAAIKLAIDALKAAGGGTLLYPKGKYKCTGQLEYKPGSRWVGVSKSASKLYCPTDLWSSGNEPKPFVIPEGGKEGGGFAFNARWRCEHMSFEGPGGGNTTGNKSLAGNKTTGVQLAATAHMIDVQVTKFFDGVKLSGNHQQIHRCELGGNYFGIRFPDGETSHGNFGMSDTDLTGCNLASIFIEGDGQMDGPVVTNCHAGFAPVVILAADPQSGWDGEGNPEYHGTPRTAAAISSPIFNGLYCEATGNGAVIDMTAGSGATFGNPGTWLEIGHAFNNGYRVTENGPLAGNEEWWAKWAVYATKLSGVFGSGANPFAVATEGYGIFKVTKGGGTVTMEADAGLNEKLLGSGSHWTTGFTGFVWRSGDTIARGFGANGTIAVGDLVEMFPENKSEVRRATTGANVLGVAMTPSGEGTDGVMVALRGTAKVNTVATITGTRLLAANVATPYKADKSSNSPGLPVIGIFAEGANATNCEKVVLKV